MRASVKKIKPVFWYGAFIFVLTAVLSYFFVWTQDDLRTTVGGLGELVRESVFYGNGRYLGNFLVNVCLSHKLLDAVVRGAVSTGIIVLLAAVPSKLTCKTLSLSVFLFAGFGNLILRESFFWGHGFYNFAMPVFCILLSMQLLKQYYLVGKTSHKGLLITALVSLGFCQQLYSENSTIIAVLLAGFIFVLVVRKRTTKGPALGYLVSSVAGMLVMFLLPRLMHVSYKMTEYRGSGIGAESLNAFVQQAVQNLFICLRSLVAMLPVWVIVSCWLVCTVRACSAKSKKFRRLKPLFYTVFCAQPVLSLVFYFVNETQLRERIPLTDIRIPDLSVKIGYAICIFFAVYIVLALIVVFLHEEVQKQKHIYVSLLVMAILSMGELLVISVLGSRCLFITACILSFFIVKLFTSSGFLSKKLSYAPGVAGILLLCMYLVIMVQITKVNKVRFSYGEQQISEGKTTIEIIRLPHEKWLFVPNDASGLFGYYFNYGEIKPPEDFTFIDYEDYLERHA
ncbi:MAG: hypothetical protein IJK02_10250 [Clostridia bacterium]|nr:hypothetical protein [Clostridia bacterium]